MTCRIAPDGLSVTSEQKPLMLVSGEDMTPDDAQFYREGVAITASGYVYMPDGKGTSATASLRVGEIERRVRATGPRVWQKGALGGVVPSAATPVDRVPMRWEHAYGGSYDVPASLIEHDGEEMIVPPHPNAYPLNLMGAGFFLEADRAVGEPLPLLEDPDAPLARWDDRPEPTCFAPYPMHGGLRMTSVVDPSDKKVDLSRSRRLSSRACPKLTFDEVAPQTPIRVAGMRPRGEVLSFEVPPAPATVDVVIGRAIQTVELQLDTIDIDAEESSARFVYRRLFRYGLVQFEERAARFVATDPQTLSELHRRASL
jgi:hypothetical protein